MAGWVCKQRVNVRSGVQRVGDHTIGGGWGGGYGTGDRDHICIMGFDVLINPFIKLQDVTRFARLGDLTNGFLAHIPTMTQSCRWKCHAFEFKTCNMFPIAIYGFDANHDSAIQPIEQTYTNIYEYNIDYHWKKTINSIKELYISIINSYISMDRRSHFL